MKLVYLLEPGDTIQDKDLYFVPPIEAPEYKESGKWKEVNVAEPKFAPSIPSLDVVVARKVTTDDLLMAVKEDLSPEWVVDECKRMQKLVYDTHEDALKECVKKLSATEVIDACNSYDVENYVCADVRFTDGQDGKAGPSFWKEECRTLLREVIMKEGWDAIYNRIKDLDPMQPDSGPSLFPETDLTDYSIKSNFIP